MTEEANAAIAAAREAGASEFVVADSHGNFQNLLVDKLPPDVQLVRGTPRPLGMMQGIDDSFDGGRSSSATTRARPTPRACARTPSRARTWPT